MPEWLQITFAILFLAFLWWLSMKLKDDDEDSWGDFVA